MLYTRKEISNIYNSTYQLNKAIYEKKIFKIQNGIYSDEEYIDFERGQDPKKSMRIGKASRSFEDSLEAGEYVRDNLFEITGFEEIP